MPKQNSANIIVIIVIPSKLTPHCLALNVATRELNINTQQEIAHGESASQLTNISDINNTISKAGTNIYVIISS
jgi:hypothetical protein